MRFSIFICCLALLSLPACSRSDAEKHVDNAKTQVTETSHATAAIPAAPLRANGFLAVTPQEAQQLIHSRQGLVMIDVRTPQELGNGVIKGSHNVPLWPVMQGKLNLPKDTPLLVICAVGGRSFAAGQALVKWGFQEVYNLKGGIDGWKQAGLPLQ